MEINSKIRSGNKEVDAYIKELEEYCLSFTGSGIKKTLSVLDGFFTLKADELEKALGKGKLNDKNEEMAFSLLDKIDKIKKTDEAYKAVFGIDDKPKAKKDSILKVVEEDKDEAEESVGASHFERTAERIKAKRAL